MNTINNILADIKNRATNSQQTGYGIVIFHINYEISTCSRIFLYNLQKTVDDNYTSHELKCHLRTVKLAKQTHKDFVNCKSKDELSSSHPLYLHIFYNPNYITAPINVDGFLFKGWVGRIRRYVRQWLADLSQLFYLNIRHFP